MSMSAPTTPLDASHVAQQPFQPPLGEARTPILQTADRVDAAALTVGLSRRDNPTPVEVDKVKVVGMKLGTRTVSFTFSVRVDGKSAPMEQEKLAQLAKGCQRSMENTYSAKQLQLRTIDQRIAYMNGLPRSRNPLELARRKAVLFTTNKLRTQVTKELSILNRMTTFDFKIKDDKPIIQISARGDDGKVEKMDIKLDPEFDGVARAARTAINQLQAQRAQLLQGLNHFLGLERKITHFEANVYNPIDQSPLIPTTHPTFQQLLALRTERMNAGYDAGTRMQLENRLRHIDKLLNALHTQDRHSIEIIKQRREGSTESVSTPELSLTIFHSDAEIQAARDAVNAGDEGAKPLPRFETMKLPVTYQKSILHFGGQVATNADLLQAILAAGDEAQEGKTPATKQFATALQAQRSKKGMGSVSGGGGMSQADLNRARQIQMMRNAQMGYGGGGLAGTNR